MSQLAQTCELKLAGEAGVPASAMRDGRHIPA